MHVYTCPYIYKCVHTWLFDVFEVLICVFYVYVRVMSYFCVHTHKYKHTRKLSITHSRAHTRTLTHVYFYLYAHRWKQGKLKKLFPCLLRQAIPHLLRCEYTYTYMHILTNFEISQQHQTKRMNQTCVEVYNICWGVYIQICAHTRILISDNTIRLKHSTKYSALRKKMREYAGVK